ncbi:MAG: protein-glutamate O-methyltransferase CheR [Gammaproteobacteria bacterium]
MAGTAPAVVQREQEFAFTDRDFRYISAFAADYAGIVLPDSKRDMVYSRLTRRLRILRLPSFAGYCDLLRSGDSVELSHFINALTTNLTSFFREPHHFDYLAKTLAPQLLARHQHDRRLRVWSAGCSSGEEPYSIAMTLAESVPQPQTWDIRILATDLDSEVLERAAAGVYGMERLGTLSASRLAHWFRRGRGSQSGRARVVDSLKQMICFRRLNLMDPWPMQGLFDAIFCRNVVIYFDKSTQSRLFERFARQMHDHGQLFVGHSESLYRVSDRFQLIGNTVYRRTI